MTRCSLLAGALLLILTAPAAACGDRQYNAAADPERLAGPPPWLIGDSTSIIAAPHLGERGIQADAEACRRFEGGISMIAARRTLPTAVALALGANADVTREQITRAALTLGHHRFLVLVTPRRHPGAREAMLAEARAHPDRILTLDWVAASAEHPEWFFEDGLHPSFSGARVYARFVARGLAPFLGPPPLRVPARRAEGRPCGTVRAFSRSTDVFVTAGDVSCQVARTRMRGPRLQPPPGWRFYDWRTVRIGPWTDVLAKKGGSIVVAGITR